MLTIANDSLRVSSSFHCKEGLILSCWHSDGDLESTLFHGLVYVLALVYLFVGIAIISDRFMAAIEVITSQKRDVVIHKPNKDREVVSVRVWNKTVSNLTLMSFGSSAPIILLPVIEIFAENFEAGQLGPSTVIGSAAFNLFIIVAACVATVPSSQVKKVKYHRVFVLTLIVSILANVWLWVILQWLSPGVIHVWEALITLAFFGLTIVCAYIADQRLLIYKCLDKRYRFKQTQSISSIRDEIKMEKVNLTNKETDSEYDTVQRKFLTTQIDDNLHQVTNVVKEIRQNNLNLSMDKVELLAQSEISKRTPKSRAHYRLLAAKCYFGSNGDICVDQPDPIKETNRDDEYVDLRFDPTEYSVMESAGQVRLTVTRSGDITSTVLVSYATTDGTAKAHSDYIPCQGVVEFGSGEAHKQIVVHIVDDDIYEESEHFVVRLLKPKYRYVAIVGSDQPRQSLRLTDHTAVVTILDDDHWGVFAFESDAFQVDESIGQFTLPVIRYRGARGHVSIAYRTVEMSAKANKDFHPSSGTLEFANNESRQFISIQIVNGFNYEKSVLFGVELTQPEPLEASKCIEPDGQPQLGELHKCTVQITESKDLRKIVNNLLKRKSRNPDYQTEDYVWQSQIAKSMHVQRLSSLDELSSTETHNKVSSEDKQDQGHADKSPLEYTLHCITFVWRFAFSVVPRATTCHGWACFSVCLILIVILTALMHDLAVHLGSTLHLQDFVTGITLVTLGTSLPDTLGSIIAARTERTADSSLGSITGSNSVNVLLGLGLAWSVGALYHAALGNANGFRVDSGNIAYSVALFSAGGLIVAVVLMARRVLNGGELGGPFHCKVVTVVMLLTLWLLYLVMSILQAYGFVPPF